MFIPILFRHPKWNSRRRSESRSCRRRPPRFLPWLEALEDRTVLSTLTVTSAADDGSAGTLRAVLAAAHVGDTIRFADQLDGRTITLKQGQLMINQNLNIDGPGAELLTVSGHAASRIFDISGGTTVIISGLTLTGGLATDGAGILNGGNLRLSNDELVGNLAQGIVGAGLFGDGGGRGGGVENQPGAIMHVSLCSFTGNKALGATGGNAFGGAIYNEAGVVTINDSTITGNQALAGNGGAGGVAVTLPGGVSAILLGVAAGGGLWNDGGAVTVTNTSLLHNLDQGGSNGDASGSTATIPFVGGGIGGAIGTGDFFTTATPTLAIAGSTLSGNHSLGGSNVVVAFAFTFDAGEGQGGALGAVAGNVSISNSTITGNLVDGGALFTTIQGGTFFGSAASSSLGGGIDDEFNLGFATSFPPLATTSLQITGSTIGGNLALGIGPGAYSFGGGLYTNLVHVRVINSTVSGNHAIGGPSGVTFTPVQGGLGIGGGMAGEFGSLSISGGTVNENLAQGGVTTSAGTFFSGGSTEGGGIFSLGQTFVITNSTLSGNRAVAGDASNGAFGGSSTGGGLFTSADSPVFGGSASISGTTFVNNLAQGSASSVGGTFFFGGIANGGGAYLSFTNLRMTDGVFLGNRAVAGAGGPGSNGGGAGGEGGQAEAGGMQITSQSTALISDTSFIQNRVQGGAGGTGGTGQKGGTGGFAEGGGLFRDSGTITLSNCNFLQNQAGGGIGGAAGSGATGGSGGEAQGGGLDTAFPGTVTVSNCAFARNGAQGGDGAGGGNGGNAEGGGVLILSTTTSVRNSLIAGNKAGGGAGGVGSHGGAGGSGTGGGLFAGNQATVTVSHCTLVENVAGGGNGGNSNGGGAAGAGGLGFGGGLANTDSTTAINNSFILYDLAQGGNGGNGGNGDGGGLFIGVNATATVLTSLITGNQANGGHAGAGGGNGQGIGGGVYNLGTFFLDDDSTIDGNDASTSNDNVYGPITPI